MIEVLAVPSEDEGNTGRGVGDCCIGGKAVNSRVTKTVTTVVN